LQCSGFTAQSATRSLRPCGIDRRRHPLRADDPSDRGRVTAKMLRIVILVLAGPGYCEAGHTRRWMAVRWYCVGDPFAAEVTRAQQGCWLSKHACSSFAGSSVAGSSGGAAADGGVPGFPGPVAVTPAEWRRP
jgi:hypothetical protein